MARRIEVELTSRREDGIWTWRAAGAKQPKGELDGALLYPGAAVGDVVRVDAEFHLDGITVTAVLPPRTPRREPERLEVLGPPRRQEELVTKTLVGGRGAREQRERERDGRSGGDRRAERPRREDRRERRERDRAAAGGRERSERSGAGRPAEGGRERRGRPERPKPEPRPKAPRLRAGRTHRNAVLAELPEEHKPIAEQVLRGGIPAVRQAVDKQNEANREAGAPEISAEPLVAIAEQLLPRLRAAEWRDRAEAALASVDVVDLRDLRSVVVAADAAARDPDSRALADELREALARRVETEHRAWLAEIDQTLEEGRVVRALRLSSRPPKAGTPFPAELASRLAAAAAASLTADTPPDRYATVLDALAYSPVRTTVVPDGIPTKPGPELLAAVTRLAARLPQVAERFGVQAAASPTRSSAAPVAHPPAATPPPALATPAPSTAAALVTVESASVADRASDAS